MCAVEIALWSQSRDAIAETGDSSGTQRKGKVSREKPSSEGWCRHWRLRISACCSEIWTAQIRELSD
jgi:hypothetical protein